MLTPKNVHVDGPLTNLSRMFPFPELIAEKVFPVLRVNKRSDVFYQFVTEERVPLDDIRSPGSAAHEAADWKTTTGSYTAEERALKKAVPDAVIENADAPVQPMQTTTKKLTYNLRLNQEIRVQAIAQNTSLIPSAAVGTKWDVTTADPQDDVLSAIETVRASLGTYPNTILMSPAVEQELVRRIKADTNQLNWSQNTGIWRLPNKWLGLDVIIAPAIKQNALNVASPTQSNVWNDNVLIFYKNPNPGLMDYSLGYIMRQRDFRVRKWRDDEREATFIEDSVVQDEKLVTTQAGLILEDVLT